ncbi:hypothetical protein [Methylorubrum zatmanii]
MSSGLSAPPAGLSEVSRLATLLADQTLDAQIKSRPIPDDQVQALLDAAVLLDEYGQELPPLLGQIVHEIGTSAPERAARPAARRDEDEVGRMAWMLRPFRSAKRGG